MVQGTPLLIGPDEQAALRALRELAAAHPVDMPALKRRLDTGSGKRAHRAQMTRQSVLIPNGFLVTFSIETGHPCGIARHMSMSSPQPSRVPLPQAVWMVASELGFVGGIEQCAVWLEKLARGVGAGVKHEAVNLVQPIAVMAPQAGRGLLPAIYTG